MTDSLPDIARGALQQRYVSAVGLTFLLYDIAITFDLEVKSIWRAKLSSGKVLFLANRYLCPAALVFDQYVLSGVAVNQTNEFCGHAVLGEYLLQVILGFGVIPAMLLLRVYMLHYGSRTILVLLIFGLCLELAVGLAVLFLVAQSQDAKVIFLPILNMCITASRPAWAWGAWVPPIAFDITIITLTVLKTWRIVRTNIRTPVMSSLLRDGLGFFVVLLNLQIFNIVAFTTLPDTLYLIDTPMSFAVSSTLVSRMFLNLRQLSELASQDSMAAHEPQPMRITVLPPTTAATSNWNSYSDGATGSEQTYELREIDYYADIERSR